jgi:AcrR family transcriptional regulator
MKDKILDAAIEVLSVRGIHHTTIRDIAKKLEISDGHLRYYFKTKEDLMLYVFKALEEELTAYTVDGGKDVFTGLDAMYAGMYRSYNLMNRYSFFFVETPYSLSAFPVLSAAWKVLFEQRKKQFLLIFDMNKQKGVFRTDISDRRYELLSEQFFILAENWIKHTKSYSGDVVGEKEVAHFANITLALFIPYFTEKYAAEVEKSINER